jgi:hypothetical protein
MGIARAKGGNPVGFHRKNRTEIDGEQSLGKNVTITLTIITVAALLMAYSVFRDFVFATDYSGYHKNVPEIIKAKKLPIEFNLK